MKKPKIYLACFPMGWKTDVVGHALAEDGAGLASHLSSNVEYSKHDLGLTSDWKHDVYQKHFPDGYELEWVDNPDTHAGWQAALALNQARREAAQCE